MASEFSVPSTGLPRSQGTVACEEVRGSPPADDPLNEVDTILDEHRAEELEREESAVQLEGRRVQFLDAFEDLCRNKVRPAMEAVAGRLRRDGGGGRIIVHPGGEARFRHPSITLWMALEGEVAETPREDRFPYFRLDADTSRHSVEVREGNISAGSGAQSSGLVAHWQIDNVTYEQVERSIVDVLRRAARDSGGA